MSFLTILRVGAVSSLAIAAFAPTPRGMLVALAAAIVLAVFASAEGR